MVSRTSRSSSIRRIPQAGNGSVSMLGARRAGGAAVRAGGERERPGQLDDEHRTHARLAVDLDRSAVGIDDLLGDVEAEAHPAVGSRGGRPLKSLEDASQVIAIDADAMVDDSQAAARGGLLDRDLDWFATAVLDRVSEQVGDDLLQPKTVPLTDDRLAAPGHQLAFRRGQLLCEAPRPLANALRQLDALGLQPQAARRNP